MNFSTPDSQLKTFPMQGHGYHILEYQQNIRAEH